MTRMSVYRRLARSRKGMSTIFGGLFFIILILMGFNLLVWGFVQYDSYNHVITTMSQKDQQAISENIVPVNPGGSNFNNANNTFDIVVNNLGGISVSIARIYIQNVSPTNSLQCNTAPCVLNQAPSSPYSFTAGNVPAGVINYHIHVQGIVINDNSGYKVILASTRGRLFTFYYPWPQTLTNSGNGVFTTNVGPLAIYFDSKSFNFTKGTDPVSQSAFCIPSGTNLVLWVKITNTATVSSVTLRASTIIQLEAYGVSGFGQFVTDYIVDGRTVNPSNLTPYDEIGSPYVLPAANIVTGPSPPTVIKFGSSTQSGASLISIGKASSTDQWIMFIGFYYVYQGQNQGETIPFLDIRSSSTWPSGC
jgi:hypothetical protein